MKIQKIFTLATVALVLTLSFASVAHAHGDEAHGPASAGGLSSLGWVVTYLPPVLALGGIAFVGVVYFTTRHKG